MIEGNNVAPRVAMLVHNGVKNDARVMKEAVALQQAGYAVEIHGISPTAEVVTDHLPGSQIPLFLSPAPKPMQPARTKPAAAPRKNKLRRSISLTVRATALGPLLLLGISALYPGQFPGGDQFINLDGIGASLLAGFLTLLLWVGRRRIDRFLFRFFDAEPKIQRPVATDTPSPDPAVTRRSAPHPLHRFQQALLKSVAARPAPDVFHLHDHVALSLASTLKQQYTAKLVWDAHEIYQEMAGAELARSQINAEIIASNHTAIDAFITINDSIAAYYREQYPAMPPATVVMNATVVEALPDYDGRLHRAAGLPETQKILLFQGGFARHRGIEALIDAAPDLPPDWTLVLMGWGNIEADLRARVAAQPVRDACAAVCFLPGVPHAELPLWSAGASLGAIPYENTSLNHLYCTPNKLWEYPNAGVPVLASDLEEMGRFIREYGFGFLLPREFSAGDIVSLVTALTDAQLAIAREHCQRFIASNHWGRWEKCLLNLYAGLMPLPTSCSTMSSQSSA